MVTGKNGMNVGGVLVATFLGMSSYQARNSDGVLLKDRSAPLPSRAPSTLTLAHDPD